MALDSTQWHILCIVLFPCLSFAGIMVAAALGVKSIGRIWFTMGVMFASGILLAGALVHNLPHATASFDSLLGEEEAHHDEGGTEDHNDEHRRFLEDDHDDHGPFPWANTIAGIAFLLLMCIEALVERLIDNYLGDKQGNFYGGAHNHGGDDIDDHSHEKERSTEMPVVKEHNDDDVELDGVKVDTPASATLSSNNKPNEQGNLRISARSLRRSTISQQFLVVPRRPSVIGIAVEAPKLEELDEKQTINPWVSVLLLVVLSIHVILEGLALGSSSDPDTIRSNFIAIVFHKGFSAFALGSSFIASGYWQKERRNYFFLFAAIYASMDIIGIASGMGVGSAFSDDSYANAILVSLLAGSFLFVAVVELIPGELDKMRALSFPVLPVMGSLLTGYAAMSLIGKWA